MRKLSKIIIVGITMVMLASNVYAQDINNTMGATKVNGQAEVVVEGNETSIREDLVTAVGEKFQELGKVNNDIIFFGDELNNQALVVGDILGIGNNLYANGNIQGNIRGIFNRIEINGNVDKNVTIMGNHIMLNGTSEVNGDFMAIGQTVTIDGKIAKNLKVIATSVIIAGSVGGNVDLTECTNIQIENDATIKGNVNYEAYTNPIISKDAKVDGKVTGKIIEKKTYDEFNWPMKIFTLFSFIAFAIIVVFVAKKFILQVAETIEKRMGISALTGAAALVIVPITIILFLISMLGFIPAIGLGFAYILILMIDKIALGLFIARKFIKDVNLYLGVVMGIVLIEALALIPVINILVGLAVLFIGTGSIILTIYESRKSE